MMSKGYQHLINTHFEKGFPESNFIESYRRYAKSLITLNGNEGKDKKTGLLFEFVLDHRVTVDGLMFSILATSFLLIKLDFIIKIPL